MIGELTSTLKDWILTFNMISKNNQSFATKIAMFLSLVIGLNCLAKAFTNEGSSQLCRVMKQSVASCWRIEYTTIEAVNLRPFRVLTYTVNCYRRRRVVAAAACKTQINDKAEAELNTGGTLSLHRPWDLR
jgi:membrane-bound metal-dependent hydrolase YbcI (DUF457 family)